MAGAAPGALALLDADGLRGLICAGAREVQAGRDHLDRINVFPVPDGDTGANMAATLLSAAAGVGAGPGGAAGQVARAAADAALMGARGNSGTILAQFLHGFAERSAGRATLSVPAFVEAARGGSEAAFGALARPREGTILTVLRVWTAALASLVDQARSFGALLAGTLPQAREALARTPEQLEVLARHRVVDAGAQGFLYFLQGATRFLAGEVPGDCPEPAPAAAVEAAVGAPHAADFEGPRFCCEALVAGAGLGREALAAAVAGLGDSLATAGGGPRVRVHLHTDAPRRFFAALAPHGLLERCKLDDMWLQQESGVSADAALLVDSTCDLPEAAWRERRLFRVPLRIEFGTDSFLDEVGLPPAAFHQRLRGTQALPRTSQPAPADFRALYARLLARHPRVLSLHLAGALSGTVEAARAAAREFDPRRLAVVDSRQVSVGLGLLARAVLPLLAADEPAQVLARGTEALAADIRVFGTVPSLAHAVRGGRVSARLAWLLDGFGLRPLIAFDAEGRAQRAGVRLGFRAALRSLVGLARGFAAGRPVELMVVHAEAPGPASYLADRLRRAFQVEDLPVVEAGAVLATHVGPGAVALAVRRRSARDSLPATE
jgi:hypothetical protein